VAATRKLGQLPMCPSVIQTKRGGRLPPAESRIIAHHDLCCTVESRWSRLEPRRTLRRQMGNWNRADYFRLALETDTPLVVTRLSRWFVVTPQHSDQEFKQRWHFVSLRILYVVIPQQCRTRRSNRRWWPEFYNRVRRQSSALCHARSCQIAFWAELAQQTHS